MVDHRKPKSEIPISKTRTLTAAKTPTIRPQQHPRSLNNEIVSQQIITEINAECEKSDRLTVANSLMLSNSITNKTINPN